MKQSTMRLRRVTLKRQWIVDAGFDEITSEVALIRKQGLRLQHGTTYARLPTAPLSPILPTSGPE